MNYIQAVGDLAALECDGVIIVISKILIIIKIMIER